MNKLVLGPVLAGLLAVLSACDTVSPVQYSASAENALAFQGALKPGGRSVQVGDFTQASSVNPHWCRLTGQMDVTSGKSFAQYVKEAFQTDLLEGGVYDSSSPVKIDAYIDEVKFNTFGNGSWTLGMQVTSTVFPTGYHVEATYGFHSSYVAEAACQNATNAFAPAVRELLSQVVNNPDFSKLVTPMREGSAPELLGRVVRRF